MLIIKAKDFFISVLEYKIVHHEDYYEARKNGFVDSLEDVLERAKMGIYNWKFDDKMNPDKPEHDEVTDINADVKRWETEKKEYEADYQEKMKNMTEEEYGLSIDEHISSLGYIVGRLNGYQFAEAIMCMSYTDEKRACAAELISIAEKKQMKIPTPM